MLQTLIANMMIKIWFKTKPCFKPIGSLVYDDMKYTCIFHVHVYPRRCDNICKEINIRAYDFMNI